jgi:hypothetical protein
MTVLSIAAVSSSPNRASHRLIEIDFPVEAGTLNGFGWIFG